MLERAAEHVADEIRLFEAGQGIRPVPGQCGFQQLVGIALQRRRRLQPVLYAVQHPAQDCRDHQVRVRIRTGHPVFKPGRMGRISGYTHRYGAILVTPARRQRRISPALKTAVGVQVGCEQQHAVCHAGQASGHGLAQQGVTPAAAVVKGIVAVGIQQTAVHMHAVARHLPEGLGHERGPQAVFAGQAFYHPAQHHGLVGGYQGIGVVVEVDLVLGRAGLLDQRIDRQVLGDAGVADGMHQPGHTFHGVDAIGLPARQAAAHAIRLGMNWLAQGVKLVAKQVKLHLGGHHRRQPEGGETTHQRLQDMPGIIGAGCAVDLAHRDNHLGGRSVQPGCDDQRPPIGFTETVTITRLKYQYFRVPPPHIKRQRAQWHFQLSRHRLVHLVARQPLAPQAATDVGEYYFKNFDVRVFGQKDL